MRQPRKLHLRFVQQNNCYFEDLFIFPRQDFVHEEVLIDHAPINCTNMERNTGKTIHKELRGRYINPYSAKGGPYDHSGLSAPHVQRISGNVEYIAEEGLL